MIQTSSCVGNASSLETRFRCSPNGERNLGEMSHLYGSFKNPGSLENVSCIDGCEFEACSAIVQIGRRRILSLLCGCVGLCSTRGIERPVSALVLKVIHESLEVRTYFAKRRAISLSLLLLDL